MSQFDRYDVFMKILALIEQDQSVSPKKDELVDRLALLIKPIREVHPSAAAVGEGSEAIEKMPEPFYFISYSRVDGEDFALKLVDQLAAGPPSISGHVVLFETSRSARSTCVAALLRTRR